MWSEITMKQQFCYVLLIFEQYLKGMWLMKWSLWNFTCGSVAILPNRLSYFKLNNYSIRQNLTDSKLLKMKRLTAYCRNRGPVSMSQIWLWPKYLRNSLVGKRTTLGATIGPLLRLWVAIFWQQSRDITAMPVTTQCFGVLAQVRVIRHCFSGQECDLLWCEWLNWWVWPAF